MNRHKRKDKRRSVIYAVTYWGWSHKHSCPEKIFVYSSSEYKDCENYVLGELETEEYLQIEKLFCLGEVDDESLGCL
jgi:hypothetical protein